VSMVCQPGAGAGRRRTLSHSSSPSEVSASLEVHSLGTTSPASTLALCRERISLEWSAGPVQNRPCIDFLSFGANLNHIPELSIMLLFPSGLV